MTRTEKKARKARALTEARSDWATRSGSYNARRSLYQQGWRYVEYHTWAAIRGFVPAGNDPMSGRRWGQHDRNAQELGREMEKAAARLYLRRARAVRAPMGVA